MDTLKSGQPPYNGQTVHPLPTFVHTFLPPNKGQPLNNGQNTRPQLVHIFQLFHCSSYADKFVENTTHLLGEVGGDLPLLSVVDAGLRENHSIHDKWPHGLQSYWLQLEGGSLDVQDTHMSGGRRREGGARRRGEGREGERGKGGKGSGEKGV